MIIRIIAVDPAGPRFERKGGSRKKEETDLIVWQVPERSRAFTLLTELLDGAGIEWAQIGGKP